MSSARPRKYRVKPAEVEAIRYWPGENCESVHAFIGAEHDADTCYAGAELVIFTDRGSETVKPGDWIVRDSSGDVHRCLDSTFAATYEEAL